MVSGKAGRFQERLGVLRKGLVVSGMAAVSGMAGCWFAERFGGFRKAGKSWVVLGSLRVALGLALGLV